MSDQIEIRNISVQIVEVISALIEEGLTLVFVEVIVHLKHKMDLVIGDREIDLIPAKELGIPTFLFQNQSDIADYHLSDYSDFFKLIKTVNL